MISIESRFFHFQRSFSIFKRNQDWQNLVFFFWRFLCPLEQIHGKDDFENMNLKSVYFCCKPSQYKRMGCRDDLAFFFYQSQCKLHLGLLFNNVEKYWTGLILLLTTY